jgi:hypothetical protein
MKIYYRISNNGYSKIKPAYVKNETCYENFIRVFGSDGVCLVADCVNDETWKWAQDVSQKNNHKAIRSSAGSSAAGFNLVLDMALHDIQDPNEIIYFVEGDYIHCPESKEKLIEIFNHPISKCYEGLFVSGYDHVDKYIPFIHGGNKYIDIDCGESTKVYKTPSSWWKITNSTTMTFASRLSTLNKAERVLRDYTNGSYPRDFEMFLKLRELGYVLVTSIPSWSTHGETLWLSSPCDGSIVSLTTEWEKIIYGR